MPWSLHDSDDTSLALMVFRKTLVCGWRGLPGPAPLWYWSRSLRHNNLGISWYERAPFFSTTSGRKGRGIPVLVCQSDGEWGKEKEASSTRCWNDQSRGDWFFLPAADEDVIQFSCLLSFTFAPLTLTLECLMQLPLKRWRSPALVKPKWMTRFRSSAQRPTVIPNRGSLGCWTVVTFERMARASLRHQTADGSHTATWRLSSKLRVATWPSRASPS